jgi:2,4-dienoyl-CoA reductase-like NADH-dependent reductase (Old Yellow Enzyme family)
MLAGDPMDHPLSPSPEAAANLAAMSGAVAAPTLSSPLRLGCGVTLPNRLFKSAMTEGLADAHDRATEGHIVLYRKWSAGGTGTLVTGNVMVDHRYLERPGNVVVEDESGVPELEKWAEAGQIGGNQLWMQVSHPGRQCSRFVTSRPVAPSPVQLRLGGLFGKPRALEDDEIRDIIRRYGETARIGKLAGFSGVQVHGAHGYLCNQFLSPRTNLRTDGWGGPLANRARFIREVVRSVRAAVGPGYPVAVKLNSSDFQKGAFSPEDSCQVAAWLVEDGVDLLEISGGTYEHLRLLGVGHDEEAKAAGTKKREAYFLEYAAAMRGAAKVPLVVTGGFRTRAAMEASLAEHELDVIGFARPLCTETDLSRRLLDGSAQSAPADEKRLRLGPGWFGPASSNATMRGLNAQAQTAWFYRQIICLSRDLPLDVDLSAGGALIAHFRNEYRLSRARRDAGR